jgi:hypothetical protein
MLSYLSLLVTLPIMGAIGCSTLQISCLPMMSNCISSLVSCLQYYEKLPIVVAQIAYTMKHSVRILASYGRQLRSESS